MGNGTTYQPRRIDYQDIQGLMRIERSGLAGRLKMAGGCREAFMCVMASSGSGTRCLRRKEVMPRSAMAQQLTPTWLWVASQGGTRRNSLREASRSVYDEAFWFPTNRHGIASLLLFDV